jgi:hypothetical protein
MVASSFRMSLERGRAVIRAAGVDPRRSDRSGRPGLDLCDVIDRDATRLHGLGDFPLKIDDQKAGFRITEDGV